jgi:hypothetical protein
VDARDELMMRRKIKEFALGLGVDDVGIEAASNYKSPRSPDLQTILPGAKSLIVLAYKSLSLMFHPSLAKGEELLLFPK